jgi:2-isopropylmalate synthase
VSQRLSHLVYDWNLHGPTGPPPRVCVSFDDETLRDGLQSPSVRNPSLEGKVRLLHLMAALGIGSADVGLPGAGRRAAREAEALCQEIVRSRLPIAPNCAARTVEKDIRPILRIMDRVGRAVEIALFLGSSPIRCAVEGWTIEDLLRRTERMVSLGRQHGAPVTFVTEDTTRSDPETLRSLYTVAVRSGASRVCVADTAGHADPLGAYGVVHFVRGVVDAAGGRSVGLDWHGHNDRGLAVANALAAALAGADRLHGTARGVGERVGNPPMEQLLVNARLLGWAAPDLLRLGEYVETASDLLGIPVPPGAPVVGRDAFRTGTGVHAAAILKAARRGEPDVVDLVYSAVPAAWLGRRQEIEIGPMSGVSNVRCWLLARGIEPEEELVNRILRAAKRSRRNLKDAEIEAMVARRAGGEPPP